MIEHCEDAEHGRDVVTLCEMIDEGFQHYASTGQFAGTEYPVLNCLIQAIAGAVVTYVRHPENFA